MLDILRRLLRRHHPSGLRPASSPAAPSVISHALRVPPGAHFHAQNNSDAPPHKTVELFKELVYNQKKVSIGAPFWL